MYPYGNSGHKGLCYDLWQDINLHINIIIMLIMIMIVIMVC